MTFEDYQRESHKTNCYTSEKMMDCLVTLLCSEAGEVAGKYNKSIRDSNGVLDKQAMVLELGDCLWALSELARELGTNLDWVAHCNIEKLRSRQERNQIGGSGDNR